jgi:photosystem II stability/assembly factor-like uncharacterized protein
LICRSTNDGATWQQFTTGTTQIFRALSFSSTTRGFAVGTNGTICIYNGTNWVAQTTGTTANFNSVKVVGNTAWAVGSGGVICRYNGSAWVTANFGVASEFYGVSFLREDFGFAVGAGGVICRYNGSAWVAVNTSVRSALRNVVVVDENTICISGDNGLLVESYDGGQTWQELTVVSQTSLLTLTVSEGQGFAFCAGGAGFRTIVPRRASGLAGLATGTERRINASWFSSNSQYGCVATDGGGIRVTNDGGRTWSTSNTGISENIYAVTQQGSTSYFAGANGVICVSTNGGQT